MIPKIIHYCWLSDNQIPDNLQRYMQSWYEKLPEYEFMLWNFKRFDIDSCVWVKQAFEAKKYAFAADYIRLYAIYHYGGIYLDMDVQVLKSFNTLLNREYILGRETNNGIEGGILGSIPGALWVKRCLEYYTNKEFKLPDGIYDTRPLPRIMYEVLGKEFRLTDKEEVVNPGGEQVLQLFPNEYLTAKSYRTGKITITSNTYCIHHFASSWFTPSQKIYKFIARHISERLAKSISISVKTSMKFFKSF